MSKPDTGLSNTKVPRQLVLGTFVDYKKVFRIHSGKYVQVHKEDEPGIQLIYIEQLEQYS